MNKNNHANHSNHLENHDSDNFLKPATLIAVKFKLWDNLIKIKF